MSENYIKKIQSELVIGLIGAIGTDYNHVANIIKNQLKRFNYSTHEIKITKDILSNIFTFDESKFGNEYERKMALMNFGNRARKESGDNSILALGIADNIKNIRVEIHKSEEDTYEPRPLEKHAFIVNSIKHPDEVHRLRQIYSNGFYLIGIHSNEASRTKSLEQSGLSKEQINEITIRDSNEGTDFGQKTQSAFQLSDFFIYFENDARLKAEISRILDLVFSKPHITPTFDEYAMFMAFSASLRSADLSRQVGAVIANNKEIISTGANDCPKFNGGLYWPYYSDKENEIVDEKDGRDYTLGYDSNKKRINEIFDEIIKNIPEDLVNRQSIIDNIKKTSLRDIIEFGRPVHAEMEAILTCSRNNQSTRNTDLFCTTFPCHNCAKHIIASGIKRVVYVEPYPKSLALSLHNDSITTDRNNMTSKVIFEPFSGVGPRKFFDLFSMSLGSGIPVDRKDKDGNIIEWDSNSAFVRLPLNPTSYIEREEESSDSLNSFLEKQSKVKE
ncbi:MAG: anti-phage dCTP deaminase [Candidatus Sericytochromatia bacterium]